MASVAYWPATFWRCILSAEGQVNLYGPGGSPDHIFQIPQAGVFGPGSAGYGYVNRIRAVDDGLYVCGDHRQFYRFNWDGQNLSTGRWVDMAASMRQAPVSDDPPDDDEAFDAWLDAQDGSVEFRDLGGSAEHDLYAVGDETWHFDGHQWQRLTLPSDEALNAIEVQDARHVALVGHNGTVLLGNAREGFRDVSGVDDNQNFTGVVFFEQQVWLASTLSLLVYDLHKPDAKIERYHTDLAVDRVDTHQLQAMGGVLWSFGYKDLAYLDTRTPEAHWVRVHHPDNPRVDQPL